MKKPTERIEMLNHIFIASKQLGVAALYALALSIELLEKPFFKRGTMIFDARISVSKWLRLFDAKYDFAALGFGLKYNFKESR